MDYTQLEGAIISWAQKQADVRIVLLAGSYARQDHLPDLWSDLDLILFTDQVQAYQGSPAWLEAIGPVWAPARFVLGHGEPEWRVLFPDGLKADFLFAPIPASAALEAVLAGSPYVEVYRRGIRVLVDKNSRRDGEYIRFPSPTPQLPTSDEFSNHINQFLVESARAARLVRRNEIWRSNTAINQTLKGHLLTMLEWHALVNPAGQTDTWYDGRFIEEWADKRALARLPETFADGQAAVRRKALLANLDLYAWLARDTAVQLGYPYPAESFEQVMGWVYGLFHIE